MTIKRGESSPLWTWLSTLNANLRKERRLLSDGRRHRYYRYWGRVLGCVWRVLDPLSKSLDEKTLWLWPEEVRRDEAALILIRGYDDGMRRECEGCGGKL
jgi:hypothetical protein